MSECVAVAQHRSRSHPIVILGLVTMVLSFVLKHSTLLYLDLFIIKSVNYIRRSLNGIVVGVCISGAGANRPSYVHKLMLYCAHRFHIHLYIHFFSMPVMYLSLSTCSVLWPILNQFFHSWSRVKIVGSRLHCKKIVMLKPRVLSHR